MIVLISSRCSVVKLLSRIVAPSDHYSEVATPNKDDASSLHDHTYGITSDPLTQFSCVLSALIHDLDHPGTSINFCHVEFCDLS
jgi:hypothetical protein